MIEISIVIPVYNTIKYLPECISSVMSQDFPSEKYEVICIDDGSSDGSSEMLDMLVEGHSNFKAIHQENKGVSESRNLGVQLAKGEYIWFVDADDLVLPDSLSIVYSRLAQEKPDRIKFGSWPCYEDITIEKCKEIRASNEVPGFDYKDKVVWNCVIKKEFLIDNSIRFSPLISYAEDEVFMAMVLALEPNNIEIPDILYFHRQNPTSLMSQHDGTHEIKRIESAIEAAKELRRIAQKECSIQEQVISQFGYKVLRALSLIQNQPKEIERKYLKEMHAAGLFPCKIPQKSVDKNPFSERKDAKVYYYLYRHLSTRWGYNLMKAFKNLASLRRRIN